MEAGRSWPTSSPGTARAEAAERGHIIGCTECQRAVREAAGLKAALEELAAGPVARAPRPLAGGRTWWLVPVGVAAAVAAWLVLKPGPDLQLQRLGQVDVAPTFAGAAIRGAEGVASPAVDGMIAYQAGEYARAATLLDETRRTDPSAGAHFFAGVSHLMAGDPDAAIEALQAALESVEGAYTAEARFYLAKALLVRGNPEAALSELTAIPPDASVYHHARALADSVRAEIH